MGPGYADAAGEENGGIKEGEREGIEGKDRGGGPGAAEGGGGGQPPMKEGPKKSKKKADFRGDEKEHPPAQAPEDGAGVLAEEGGLTNNVPPSLDYGGEDKGEAEEEAEEGGAVEVGAEAGGQEEGPQGGGKGSGAELDEVEGLADHYIF